MIRTHFTLNGNDGSVSWTYIDGHTSDELSGKVAYMKLLSKSNDNFLVVPSSVGALSGNVTVVGDSGGFWSSSLVSGYADFAWYGYFINFGGGLSGSYRCVGVGVRGVVSQ